MLIICIRIIHIKYIECNDSLLVTTDLTRLLLHVIVEFTVCFISNS